MYDPNMDTELLGWVKNNVIPVVEESYKVKRHTIVGSTYIQGKQDSDLDVLVLVENLSMNLDRRLGYGWKYGGSTPVECDDHYEKWGSWKKMLYRQGTPMEVNLLVCTNEAYFNNWMAAAEVCRFLARIGAYSTLSWKQLVRGVHDILMGEELADEVAERLGKESSKPDTTYSVSAHPDTLES